MSELGERLRKLAKVLGMEDQELAKVAEIGQKTFASYRSGQAYPRFAALEKWARELGVSTDWLILGEEPMFRGEKTPPQVQKPQEDLVVVRAERIAALMQTHGASAVEIRDAIMASMRVDMPSVSEPKSMYALHEPVGKYEEK